MGQLAERCYYAPSGGCARADHAFWIQVSVVWSRCDKTEHLGGCAAAPTVAQPAKKGAVSAPSVSFQCCHC